MGVVSRPWAVARKNYSFVIRYWRAARVDVRPQDGRFAFEKSVISVEKMRLSGWYVNVRRPNWWISVAILGKSL
jgi:hypothetical protein